MPYSYKLYENDELPHRAKLVYLYLFDRKDREGIAWPGINRMAADLSVSRSTVNFEELPLRGGYGRRNEDRS